jgi:FG-GAP repeat
LRCLSQGGEGEVWLEVDDRDAVWPVTIDPTFTQQQKLEASDAAAQDEFGVSVAIHAVPILPAECVLRYLNAANSFWASARTARSESAFFHRARKSW